MNDPSPTNANPGTAAAAFGCLALGIQVVGLVVAMRTPYDNQGAVGKALVAFLTQVPAIPTALTGLVLSIVGHCRGSNKRLGVGLVASIAGLIPLALLYVKIVA